MGGDCELGLTTDKKLQKKLFRMHQAPLCELQRELKFGIEDKKWR